MIKLLLSVYVVILGAMVGMVMSLGMLSAPVVFHPEKLFDPTVMTTFQSGLMMSAIFDRFNHILLAVFVIVLGMEGYIQIVRKQGCLVDGILLGSVLVTSGSFLWYFTPAIKALQAKGDAMFADPTFQTIHLMSEWDFKFLLASFMMLAFARLSRFACLAKEDEPKSCCR